MPNAPRTGTELTPEQRLQQIAAILSRGLLRFQRRIRRSESRPPNNEESFPTGLEVLGETRLSVSRRVRG